MANFLGVESCITFGMGFSTNANNIPCLVNKDSLIISDSLNHTSIVLGSRLSNATIKTFKNNDMNDLENKLLQGIQEKKYNKILIIVEGIYSMEGVIVNLPEIIRIKKKYKAYLYIDEAHSIGAIGPNGKGVVDFYGCNPKDVDILMGTFTKSFASAGGYIAGSKQLIDYIRMHSQANCYATSMSSPTCKQITYVLNTINNNKERCNKLKYNTIYFRRRLKEIGFKPIGHSLSPVVPVMIYIPYKLILFSREMLKKNIAVVVVGFPATNLYGSRVRFCVSSAHTIQMLDYIIESIKEINTRCKIV